MGTRSIIGRKTGGSAMEGTLQFEGRYHHWDGYPTRLGRTLLDLYLEFDLNMTKLCERLIDALDAKAGWSTIVGRDFSLSSISPEQDTEQRLANPDAKQGPIAYALRPSEANSDDLLNQNSDVSQEWGYIFDLESNQLYVLTWLYQNGSWNLVETLTLPKGIDGKITIPDVRMLLQADHQLANAEEKTES